MLNHRPQAELGDRGAGAPLVAIAIDKDKGSQCALKWAIENVVAKGQTITLIHVNNKSGHHDHHDDGGAGYKAATDPHTKELFLPFRCFCTRKDIHCEDVVLEDSDVAKAIVEFVSQAAIEKLVVGAPSKGGFVRRFKTSDIPSNISKGAPDFCTVWVISKGKVQSVRNAVRAAPTISPLRAQIQSQASLKPADITKDRSLGHSRGAEEAMDFRSMRDESIKSPFSRGARGCSNIKSFAELSLSSDGGADISFVSSSGMSSGRPSIDRPSIDRPSIDRMYPPRLSNVSDSLNHSFESSSHTPHRSSADAYSIGNDYSYQSNSSGTGTSWSSHAMDDVEAEMKRLKLELKQTMDMYSAACKEALTAKQKALELHRWKIEEEQRLEEARHAEESALALVERERAKCRAAIENAEAQQRIAELEAQKRLNIEMQALKESEERKAEMDGMGHDIRYRRYTIEEIEQATNFFADDRKIGEGGYGPVFKCYLDHTPVAIKVLRPDAAQGRSQFNQEAIRSRGSSIEAALDIQTWSYCLGAVLNTAASSNEYMAQWIDDRLFRRGNTPVIPWQHRFRISAEIATGLLFLHQTKPEPLVHRDLKPGNILLDRNYVSKISDVGLARLVPPTYQQTGMLGVKSDVYSLGVMLLQIITAKPPMGLTHHVSRAIDKGTFAELLDPAVTDWPVQEAQRYAELALQCAELRRKDRPDLATIVLPELNRLRALGEESMDYCLLRSTHSSPMHSHASVDVMSDPHLMHSGYGSSRTSNASNGRRSNVG
ncbi:uncharacterized protein A4U43_C05F30990 [Asparagus officinalis]|uniref:RING-type E3 ubiquitin transferase n=1 Tax=Asparagus officinalis TaxID=4686 RepID=A0A5P1F168_ASPOF|nr:uncharacterized protein A4U43_C05F30990 [Asparagus officinalis]